ncbi:MAG: kelch repeat-containing protein [Clostridiaceae bacterium]|nr:kelch repeat-containing protein [Clostridiaceae bacterium]
MSEKRCVFNTEVINGKIYALGGIRDAGPTNSFEVFDPTTNTWTILAQMPLTLQLFQSVVIDGKIYVTGGLSNGNSVSSTEVYDPSTNSWTTLPSMSVGRASQQTVVINGKIYAFGGYPATSSVEVYDPTTCTWTTLTSMSTARYNSQAEVVDGKIYVIGGYDGVNSIKSAEVYDPAQNSWTTLASMQTTRADFETEVINGNIYAIGGSNGNYLSSVERYDPTANTWTTLASMSTARKNLQTEVVNGRIYALGGGCFVNNVFTCHSSVELYDPSTNTWSTQPSMSVGRSNLQTEVINGRIYAIGGRDKSESYLGSAEVFQAIPFEALTTLTVVGNDAKVDLAWGAVTGATSYNVYRSTTSGGTYTQLATGVTGTAYTDSTVTNGTTYYYVVTAVFSGEESSYSNEASATPEAAEAGYAILLIYMTDGTLKEYDLTMVKVNEFIDWYDLRAFGTGKNYFIIEKTYNRGPYTARKDYIIFDKIRDFEVNQYD